MDTRTFERNVTLGFKLLAGHYAGAITKDAIADLPKTNKTVPWGTLKFEELLNEVGTQLSAIDMFRYWRSWNLSLIEATSDAVAINFLLMLARDWERKDRPAKGSGAHDAFVKNAVGLLDRSVYEYVSGAWGGSGDSRIATNLASVNTSPAVWAPVSSSQWSALMDEVVELGELRGQDYTAKLDSRVVLLLYYRNVVKHMKGPDDASIRIHVDHIIPRKLFESEPDLSLQRNRNHISNLALLPATENGEKSGHRLSEIKSAWVRDQISKYEDIAADQFDKFDLPEHSPVLLATRGPMLKSDLGPIRASRIADPGGPT